MEVRKCITGGVPWSGVEGGRDGYGNVQSCSACYESPQLGM
jgi:hypothetical protein